MRCPVLGKAPQGSRWWFAKQSVIGNREASQLPETVVGSDLGHRLRGAVGLRQRTADEMHPPQGEVTDRSHPEVLLACVPDGSLRCPDGSANLCQVQRSVEICLKELFEPRDDDLVAELAAGAWRNDAISHTSDQGVDQLLVK